MKKHIIKVEAVTKDLTVEVDPAIFSDYELYEELEKRGFSPRNKPYAYEVTSDDIIEGLREYNVPADLREKLEGFFALINDRVVDEITLSIWKSWAGVASVK